MQRPARRIAIALGACLAASCAPRPEAPPPPTRANAVSSGLTAGPSVASLALVRADAEAARRSFIESCLQLLSRHDGSGIGGYWTPVCDAAPLWANDPAGFFEAWFETVRVASGEAFLTGYFEPQIAGSRERRAGYDVPVYGLPRDLIRDPAYTGEGRGPLGRIDARGDFVAYHERSAIAAGALADSAPVIAWAQDPIDFFFLQIQGSGQLIDPDGRVMRIGYAGQNGREYVTIGRTLRERGILAPGEATMQGIVQWLRANPAAADEVMNENKSWIFFTELTGDAPLGALGVPVRARASVAVDPNFVPLGAPVFIDASHDIADGLWIAQDTGGAIKGANRFDTFWGAGDDAKRIAGGMSTDASALILLPKGTLARLRSR